ncbi:Glutamine--fructose-6-phosphate aminotransferase [Candidatus Bealeia paramacronuclearis]|uniref:Glutamine--fructose-6-phosphate aminotransferase [isomerizing] n=1 Tax=Candidatus Bealeia paramacronuclearis TaxID=1921001 RepID=A0ABZ2C5S2_9PROT|nr:Glutamine--fructose-6-phosphate aminotransferase [Candidatus Bealeia paramacronuclearis]
MCGIVGIVGNKNVAQRLIESLGRLEYRGYDSAGIASVYQGKIERRRAIGKLINLDKLVQSEPLQGHTGIGHTRWATHGEPSERNAHPHSNGRVAVVHNGIIENYAEIRKALQAKGISFESDTDTEVVVHLITSYLDEGLPPQKAAQKAFHELEGAYALGVIFEGYDNLLIGARKGGSPLAVGYGDEEMYLGSDAMALASLTKNLSYLEEGDWVVLSPKRVTIYNQVGEEVDRPKKTSQVSLESLSKKNYRHFMLKEIHEQKDVIEETLAEVAETIDHLSWDFLKIPRLTIVACGTSYYAGLVAKYWFEQIARLPVEIDIASEFRYRTPPMETGGLSLFISQSGETIDTLAALEYAKSQGQHILSIVNVPESSISRASDVTLLTKAGPEIGVASTKAFTTQLVVLSYLAISIALKRGQITDEKAMQYRHDVQGVAQGIELALLKESEIEKLAHKMVKARDILYLGRGVSYPIAMEGALKLKEISYIHAEGYAAGEMKHGPIALIDESVPVIVVAPFDDVFEKTISNAQEALARGAQLVIITDEKGKAKLHEMVTDVIMMPETTLFTSPLIYTIPVQLLAYYTALLKGTDVDQPRNLAKSVTVE